MTTEDTRPLYDPAADERDWIERQKAEDTHADVTERAARLRIEGTWLAEEVGHCTCGAGGEWGHEPHCGLEPVVDLSTLHGWAGLLAVPAPDRDTIDALPYFTFEDPDVAPDEEFVRKSDVLTLLRGGGPR